MSRELDLSWVAMIDETIRRKVAAGDTDQEIRDAMLQEWSTMAEWNHVDTHLRLLRLTGAGTAPREAAPSPDRGRGRNVSDLPGAYDDAIRAIRSRHGKLTWPAVAEEISTALSISLDPGTLRGWCKADGLPHPGVRERLMPT